MLYNLQIPGAIPDVTEIRVLEWHGKVGHTFAPGELIVEVETHKAVVEIRAEEEVTLRSILCVEGDWQRVGVPLALVSQDANEPLSDDPNSLAILSVNYDIN